MGLYEENETISGSRKKAGTGKVRPLPFFEWIYLQIYFYLFCRDFAYLAALSPAIRPLLIAKPSVPPGRQYA